MLPSLAEILILLALTSVVWIWVLPYKRYLHVEGPAQTSALIADGARLYLGEQSRVLRVLVLGCWLPLCYISKPIALGFVLGAACAWFVGQVAMRNATSANLRVVYAGQASLASAVGEAIFAGCRAGVFVTWLPCLLLMIATLHPDQLTRALYFVGLLSGTSLVSLLVRVGGGVFTKGADIGADLAGKLENGLPEDDIRNPAVLADNIGDNVGDCAGIATDTFESTVFALAVTCMLCNMHPGVSIRAVLELLGVVFGGGVLGATTGILYVLSRRWRISSPQDVVRATYRGLVLSTFVTFVSIGAALAFTTNINPLFSPSWLVRLLPCLLLGLILNLAIVMWARVQGDLNCAPITKIIAASEHGAGANVIEGLAVGMNFVFLQLAAVALVLLLVAEQNTLRVATQLAFVAIGMFSQACFMLSIDGYGPIVDNAGGIAEVNGLEEVRKATDLLDAAGNTLKGTTKSFLMIASTLSVCAGLCYLAEMCAVRGMLPSELHQALRVALAGLLLGIGTIYLFSGMIMEGVRRASAVVVADVRAQFSANPDILLGKANADHGQTIRLLVRASLREVATPILSIVGIMSLMSGVGWLAGRGVLLTIYLGFALGVLCGGVPLGLFMICSGGAWDNAKKAIEATGMKGTSLHHAAVVGDTVGDPFKDTVGTSINPAIKFVWAIVALTVFASMPSPAVRQVLPLFCAMRNT